MSTVLIPLREPHLKADELSEVSQGPCVLSGMDVLVVHALKNGPYGPPPLPERHPRERFREHHVLFRGSCASGACILKTLLRSVIAGLYV